MLAYCTYCSAQKNHTKAQLPAIELYKSERITKVFNSAQAIDVKFVILSGKYGIVDAHKEIKDYDHLLSASEVNQHSNLIATQIKNKSISEIVFFMNHIENDNNLKPYLDCIIMACDKSGVSLIVKKESYTD